ncbi:MAG: prolyl oligopeptidase family serine peptidase, partial [Bacteroidia bacterium]|nr:prolyl oligopeptidase family serine peptidase [Bacteroidia bacterium]
LRSASPLFFADKIRVPVLVAQGVHDPRVKKQESDQIVDALRNNNIEVKYILKDNEGHGFRNQENKIEFYQEMEQFLQKHLMKRTPANEQTPMLQPGLFVPPSGGKN